MCITSIIVVSIIGWHEKRESAELALQCDNHIVSETVLFMSAMLALAFEQWIVLRPVRISIVTVIDEELHLDIDIVG